mmetsp:Transcript_38477/g.62276  ORF Transcript_38477/g.62276 Transcript_38477/m.62276 type:complete len:795 (-) Transcript_38477:40-2424(-)
MAKKTTKKAPASPSAKPKSTQNGKGTAKEADKKYEYIGNHDNLIWWAARIGVVAFAIKLAYEIRLYAIKEYGLVIHEFDPWFNYRATEYLYEHGLKAFFQWYDYMSWYPLGRPVGTTIYPGMQMTSVAIKEALDSSGYGMSLNDVCCYVPAWFGVSATLFVGLLAAECAGNWNAGAMAALVMACIPAHTMRSVGGGYDNESIAVTAMSMTFYFWCRSLRNNSSGFFGVLTGLAYVYMVAAWGGYVFVLNMVGIHAIFLVFIGHFNRNLYWAYSLFYFIGTLGAIQIPVVNLTPLKSLEQLGPFGVFGIYQLLYFCDIIKAKNKLDARGLLKLRIKVFALAAIAGVAVCVLLWPTGYFGPLSSRVRGLFVQHTRTGNPLVDSVAEHQPASANAYYQYLHFACYLAPLGFVLCLFGRTDAKYFLILYAIIAYFFSAKMVRLIILLGPIASVLSGVSLAKLVEWSYDQFFAEKVEVKKSPSRKNSNIAPEMKAMIAQYNVAYEKNSIPRKIFAAFICYALAIRGMEFHQYCHYMANAMSNPSIMFFATLRGSNERILVDDYREAYFWLRDQTPEDSRVMAWWDYGYQITGIGNRTTIADGNTWNHEHIATLGRCLVSEEKEAHRMIRHLADYVLVWSGGGGDDLAKMPHIARIANSVYSSVCDGDPLCSQLGFLDRQMTPSPFMAKSLIYKLHSAQIRPGVTVNPQRFQNVFNSKYGKVRIWKVLKVDKKSKEWVANPENRVCDPPGSWICKGQYPPAFQKFVNEKKDFQQLEDFNVKKSKDAEEYQRKYHEKMQGK